MAELRLLAIDIGAESGRGVVGIFDGQRLRVEEVHRFANVPVQLGETLYWDLLRIFGDVQATVARAGNVRSVGVDTWGVDFGLIDGRGRLLGNPVHYRDRRTAGMLQRLPRQAVYARTGIQFLEINTVCQLLAMRDAGDPDLERADKLLLMPDLINHFLCGSSVCEYTNASTTQCLDVVRRTWAADLLEALRIPRRLFADIVPPGSLLGTVDGVQVVAPATHDTASAVASIPLDRQTAYLSSGTWSLLGLELNEPITDERALAANLTNEGGVGGTIRLLKNVMGLWLLQQARAALSTAQGAPSYAELQRLAEQAPPFTACVDPDDGRFLRVGPRTLPAVVDQLCQATHQPPPRDAGTLVRVLLESLALKYAAVLRQLEAVTGQAITAVHMVGGGVRNSLLCELAAGATGVPVLAGSAEATAIGNLVVQAIGLGELGSLGEARQLVADSFPVRRYEPAADWSAARARFDDVLQQTAVA